MILSAQSIRRRCLVAPFHERTVSHGKTFGLSAAGYDVRIREAVILRPGDFALASTLEHFHMTDDVLARVADKSSWARKGLTVQNTVIEPGWRGYLTLELANHGPNRLVIPEGSPIAQIIFELLDEPTEQPYAGKYQNQMPEPVAAIEEVTP
jgi:dCTP deaminase